MFSKSNMRLLLLGVCLLFVKIPTNAQQETCSAKDQPCSAEGDVEDEIDINRYSEGKQYTHTKHLNIMIIVLKPSEQSTTATPT